eukprot:CAMPEP_0172609816 /NCGR_PEP_ID=MMETSP1068-20121228/29734_1 /TAXON_ID=35684 /ORGANISM="Pseudopedinella elastica, Strain CCMP716" /LENGTH=317 /DNA_ID=CAMNT_0013413417 /DNA_START=10 /DNA_END=963 /DNA_ORIENTATION=-
MVLTQLYAPAYVEESSGPAAEAAAPPRRRRQPDQLRPVHMQVGPLTECSGSAFVSVGGTQVLVAVLGPYPAGAQGEGAESIDNGQLICDLTIAPIALQADDPSGARQDAGQDAGRDAGRDWEGSAVLRATLAPSVLLAELPKCVVHVHALVLARDGGELGAAVCASSLALADAGVPLRGLVAACTAITTTTAASTKVKGTSRLSMAEGAATDEKAEVALDPTRDEAAAAQGSATLAELFTEAVATDTDDTDGRADQSGGGLQKGESWCEGVVQFSQSGMIGDEAQLGESLALCQLGCRSLRAAMEAALLSGASKPGA